MNIKEAKEEIRHTVWAYLAKDASGNYKIPAIRQRPILMIGPPGIGKTQIMEQIAAECGIDLVSYTITHHTRQSAVGLPMIREAVYQGTQHSVTEYTMSEIIASVYRKMEDSGRTEGILFLDEINCVSETLAPTMLQFLQCKTFGNQALPKGWIVAGAGNPPEYNTSVREFDVVTLDRVRLISVEADYHVWMEYAKEQKLHGALLSYLKLREKNFYRIEADPDGMQYVTARGWEDFDCLLKSYEAFGLPVSEEIVYEYLHQKDVAEDVAAYLDLYRKYRDDYGIDKILAGKVKPAVFARITAAGFDERLSVVNLLLDGLKKFFARTWEETQAADRFFSFLISWRDAMERGENPKESYKKIKEEQAAGVDAGQGTWQKLWNAGIPSDGSKAPEEAFAKAREVFEGQRMRLEEAEGAAGRALEYAFDFMEEAFSDGEELVVFVTELTVCKEAAAFLAEYACGRYLLYHKQLLVGSRKAELLSELRRE